MGPRVVIGGISQGGTVALKLGLEHGAKVAGGLALRTLLMPEVEVPLVQDSPNGGADAGARDARELTSLAPLLIFDAGNDTTYRFQLSGPEYEKLIERPGYRLLSESKKGYPATNVPSEADGDNRPDRDYVLASIKRAPQRGEMLWCKQPDMEHAADQMHDFPFAAQYLAQMVL